MLYEALSQPLIFLYMMLGGYASGLLFDAKNILLAFFKKNNKKRIFLEIFKQILMFFATFLAFLIFFFTNLRCNFGQIRVFEIFVFLLSLSIERFFVINFVANPCLKCYNKIRASYERKREKIGRKKRPT